jgi:putative alpha-1,2-mannosidase
MSAWYVWSALGMYPETPGTGYLALNSPEFSQERIMLGSGKTITVSAPQAAPDAPYVQSLRLDGRGWPRNYLPPSVLSSGASLDYTLGTAPDTAWGSGAQAAPPSYPAGAAPAIPYTQPSAAVSLSRAAAPRRRSRRRARPHRRSRSPGPRQARPPASQ